jgi:D-alanyl-D-alanine carboxypeptidase
MSKFNLQAIILVMVLLWLVWGNKSFNPSVSENRFLSLDQNISLTSITARNLSEKKEFQFNKLEGLTARSAVVKNLKSSVSFLKWNAEQRWPIASLTKLMTAVIALEKIPASQKIVFNDKIIATEGNAGEFRSGDVFSVSDLVKALLVVSSNDAAMALAEDYGYRDFINAMQLKAADLEMNNSTFFDPTGLSFLNQSTIIDLEKLVKYVFDRHPEILQISQQPKVVISGNRRLLNINEFAGEKNFVGGKTGFTDDASGNLISLFKDSSEEIILIIVLGTDNRFGETRKLLQYVLNSKS